jgi:hypothetical protein
LGTLMPGQRYVLWCSTGGATLGSPPLGSLGSPPSPPFDAIYFATVLEPIGTTKSGANARITIDDSDCVYDGDTTPKALTFNVDVDNYASTTYARFELDRIPTNVTNEEVEAFFEEAQHVLAQGGEFAGPPKTWRLINGAGAGTRTGGMRLGDPTNPDQMLVPGQRYVLWCSTGEPTEGSPPDAIFFATVLEPNE